MNVGDLVTLSAYGVKLSAMWTWAERARAGRLIGMVTECKEGDEWYNEGKKMFQVNWIGEGPKSRAGNVRWVEPFTRKDLKIVSRRKT